MHRVQGRALVEGQGDIAKAFLSQSMPKNQSPGTLALNHVITINIPKTDPELKKMGGVSL